MLLENILRVDFCVDLDSCIVKNQRRLSVIRDEGTHHDLGLHS